LLSFVVKSPGTLKGYDNKSLVLLLFIIAYTVKIVCIVYGHIARGQRDLGQVFYGYDFEALADRISRTSTISLYCNMASTHIGHKD